MIEDILMICYDLFGIVHMYIFYLKTGYEANFVIKENYGNMQKTAEQRIFIVEQFILTGSRTLVIRAFANTFRENIHLKTVDRVIKKWRSKRRKIRKILGIEDSGGM